MAVAAACSAPGEQSASSESALAEAGRWSLPSAVAAAGALVRNDYDDAPRWTGSAACSGKLKPGGHKLGEYLLEHFAVVTSVGGYACRRNTADASRMSVHGTGRALDVFIPTVGGAADNGQGDKVANWLVTHATKIGVQLVIWDRSIWRANGRNDGPYGGPNPHVDHIHVELTNEAAALGTPWFADMTDDTSTTTADGGTTAAGGGTTGTRADAGTDSGTRTDSGTTTTPDAGDYEGDAATGDPADDDHTDDGPDASTGKPDSGSGSGSTSPTTSDPADGLGSAADEPGETDSLPDVPSTSRRSSASLDDDTTPNKGCSAAPRGMGEAPAGTFGGTLALALGVVAFLRRKRS